MKHHRRAWLRGLGGACGLAALCGLDAALGRAAAGPQEATGEQSEQPAAVAERAGQSALPARRPSPAAVHTVLGPVAPEQIGAALMHEHAPLIDWSELFENPAAPLEGLRDKMLQTAAAQLDAFHRSLPEEWGPGAIVECTPIRVGRYPDLLQALARRTQVHVIACTGFWGEAMAPAHPWAVELLRGRGGVERVAELYIKEIREGMEDPSGRWGEHYTAVRAGIIKTATSTYLRPIERRLHEAAALACLETGCPITTHTTDGGGWEQAQLLLQRGVPPQTIIIGHQGHLDDRQHEEAHDLHRQLAELGCYVQFDRVGQPRYELEKIARQVRRLCEHGHASRVLFGHDRVPYVYRRFADAEGMPEGWEALDVDLSVVPVKLAAVLRAAGISAEDVHAMLVENPARVLAF